MAIADLLIVSPAPEQAPTFLALALALALVFGALTELMGLGLGVACIRSDRASPWTRMRGLALWPVLSAQLRLVT